MFSRYLPLPVALLLSACGPAYDPENTVGSFYAETFCTKGTDYYDYEDECEKKSTELVAFIKERDGGDYLMVIKDPKGIRNHYASEFIASISGGHLNSGEKLRMKGVFEGTSFTGLAQFSAESYEKVDLTEDELNTRETRKMNERLDREEAMVSRAYYHCADKAMAQHPGIECDKPINAGGFGRIVEGEVKIEAICYLVDRAVIIECDGGQFGMNATLTRFEVK